MKLVVRFIFGVVLVFGVIACAGKKAEQYAGVDGDYVLGTPLPDRIEGSNFFGSTVNRGDHEPIYFGFDSYEISEREIPKIQDLANAMRQMSNDVIIAGFTDERGTDEYNRGLGERRAQSVRSALIKMGINSKRVQTVSFGKEMPADPASNEAAWAKNRRAEIGMIR